MIRIFIADDHSIVRLGLRQLFASTPDIVTIGEAIHGREVLEKAEHGDWDILLLDLSLPRVAGVEILRRLRVQRPELAIIVLSMYPEDQYARRLLQEGAAAYVGKNRSSDELLQVIRRVARGEVDPAEQRQQLGESSESRNRQAHDLLTAREHQVFTLLIQGQTPSDICAELDLTSGTVSNHIHKIKQKLGAPSIANIIHYAHRCGLID